MLLTTSKFRLIVTLKAQKQLDALPTQFRLQYDRAFQRLSSQGPAYRSLRTHRYLQQGREIWGSSASMFLRFYWDYAGEESILIVALDSH
jgi:hypothetical protein